LNRTSPITIAITGPESTGKSMLACQLASHYNTVWVPEYAREFLATLTRPYVYEDILAIAVRQDQEIDNAIRNCREKFLFLDTELTVTKIWSIFKYGKCHAWIEKRLTEQTYDFYLLTDIDLPWQPDPLREHPDKREELFNLYSDELKSRNHPYDIVSGTGKRRLENAVRIIDEKF
jgi:NadR type nicotinamide-nucleotide adenylyltransferase